MKKKNPDSGTYFFITEFLTGWNLSVVTQNKKDVFRITDCFEFGSKDPDLHEDSNRNNQITQKQMSVVLNKIPKVHFRN